MAVPGVRARLVRVHLGGRGVGDVASPVLPALPHPRSDHDVAAAVTAGWATGGLVLAAWLHHNGHRSMCSVIRSPAGLVLFGVFLLHLARAWGRYDPFDFMSARIPVRRFP